MAVNSLVIIDQLDQLRNENLYVHNDELKGIKFNQSELIDRPVYLVETLATLNVLVKKGTMLLYGGHGGGKTTLSKYLGQIFLGRTNTEIEQSILRGHPQLTEEKILGSLNFKQIISPDLIPENGNIEVQWNDFVKSQWKIIDEVNRLSPYAQNILLSLLAEGIVKYQNQSFPVGNFTVFATMNPPDEGNFDLPMPFMDRFAIALPITMPDYLSMQTIGKRDKLSSNSVNFKLGANELDNIQEEIEEIEYEKKAEELINNIIADYRLCIRISKEASENLTVDNGLCTQGGECRFKVMGMVCHKIKNPLSVRVKEDLYRYGRAFAWLLGYEKVSPIHIKIIAPYLIWHRSSLSQKFQKENMKSRFEDKDFSINGELEGTIEIINQIYQRFEKRYDKFIYPFNEALQLRLSKDKFAELLKKAEESKDSDLLVGIEILTELQKLESFYDDMLKYEVEIDATDDINTLNEIKNKLKREYKVRNRQLITKRIDLKINQIKSSRYEVTKIEISDVSKINKSSDLMEIFVKFYGADLRFEDWISRSALLSGSSNDYILNVKHYRQTDGVKLICKYQGPDNNIKSELIKIGKPTL